MAKIDGATLLVRNLKRQGVEYMFGVVGFPVQQVAIAAHRKVSPISVCAMSRWSVRSSSRGLFDWTTRGVSDGLWAGGRSCAFGFGKRAAELLANDFDRSCAANLSKRYGIVPGGAPGSYLQRLLQIRSRYRARPSDSVLCGTERCA